jgi:hypothetical protein
MRRIAKLIWWDGQSTTVSSAFKKGIAGLVAQDAGTESDAFVVNYNVSQQVVIPFQNQINSLVSQVVGVKTSAKTAVQNYLQKIVAPELDLAQSAPVATIGTALVANMTSVSGYVLASGTIFSYFHTNFGVTLPTDADPNILDAWVDDDVIEVA